MFKDLDKFLFMSEAEGLDGVVNTRLAKMNAIVNEIYNWELITEKDLINKAYEKDIYPLTEAEKRYIINALKN